MSTLTVHPDRIAHETACFVRLREELQNEYQNLDAETLGDTLDGLTNLRDLLAAIIRSALEDEALADALENRLAVMKQRLDRFRARASKSRALVTRAMSAADIASLKEADFTASLRKAAPVLAIYDETQVPAAYWKPRPAKLDRQSLLSALKEGAVIDGVSLSGGALQLSVRTK